jgi:hypothetical protein
VYSTSSENALRHRLSAFVDEFNKSFVLLVTGVKLVFSTVEYLVIFHIEMRAAGSDVSQWRDRMSVGIECKRHDKVFQSCLGTTNTDVVRTYNMLTHGTACPENTRSKLYAVNRPNMSTATLQETAGIFFFL